MKSFMRQARPRTWLDWLAVVVIAAIFAAGCLITYWIHFDDNPPLEVYNEPLPVMSEQESYQVGDTILFRIVMCRRTRGRITYTRRWVDGLMYIEPSQELAGADEECQSRNLVVTVPPLPPGAYYVEYDVTYQVNPLAARTVVFRTESVEVVGDD